MNEHYRPFTAHEKKIWKIRHEPRGFEYKLIPLWQLEGRRQPTQETQEETEAPFWLQLLCGLLSWLDAFDIDGEEKIETPQSKIG
jgi:hypothetical protein